MRNLKIIAIAALVAIGLAGTAIAHPPGVLIAGGGVANNDDSLIPGLTGVGLLTAVGGLVAKTKGAGVDINGNGNTVWAAKGQIESKLVVADDPTRDVSTPHGKVVCIALRPATSDYEVRFKVTRSSGDFAVPVGDYGSVFVKDSGRPSAGGTDMVDESFDPAELDNSDCDVVSGSAHEPVVAGNLTVRVF